MADIIGNSSNCVIKVDDGYFLLVEVEAKESEMKDDHIVVIPVTREQAKLLLKEGFKQCPIQDRPPTPELDQTVESKGIFITDNQVFQIFDVKNSTNKIVLVKMTLQGALEQTNNGTRMITAIKKMTDIIANGSNFVIEVDDGYFLLVEAEAKESEMKDDHIVVIPVTRDQAKLLLKEGFKRCPIQARPPTPELGQTVESKGIFITDNQAFQIFDVKNSTNKIVLVKMTLQGVLEQTNNGARVITAIKRSFPGALINQILE